ncbi:MAG: DUF4291 domain-containing protein [Acidobacteriota bacterium]
MTALHEIRADHDRQSIVMYQAYSPAIADPALEAQRFVAPFSFHRMTWIKPSFLWLMHRSQWGRKSGQERTLAVRITRSGWERALSLGVLTHPEPSLHPDATAWKKQLDAAHVHVQWDPERSLRGAALSRYSIQVGLSRHVIRQFVDDWIVSIDDLTPTVAKIRKLLDSGETSKARRLVPAERRFEPSDRVSSRRLLLS